MYFSARLQTSMSQFPITLSTTVSSVSQENFLLPPEYCKWEPRAVYLFVEEKITYLSSRCKYRCTCGRTKENYPSISLTEMLSSLDTLRSTLKFESYGAFMCTEILLQIKTK